MLFLGLLVHELFEVSESWAVLLMPVAREPAFAGSRMDLVSLVKALLLGILIPEAVIGVRMRATARL